MSRTLGERVREFRARKNLTQVELAQGFITPSMVSQIESDRARPSYKVLVALASRLDVSLEQLLNGVRFDLESSSKYKLAVGMVRAKEYTVAIPLLESLLETASPKIAKEDILLELARCQLEVGNVEEAESKLNAVVNGSDPDAAMFPLVWYYLGKAAELKREIPIALFHTKRALEEVQKAVHIDTDLHVKILMQSASLLEKIGKAAEAARHYERALQMDHCSSEERAQTYLRLAKVFHRQEKYEQAEAYASKAAVLLEEQANQEMKHELQQRTIMLLRGSGDWKEAVQQLLSLAKRCERETNRSGAGKVYADIALICCENRAYDEAWTYSEQAQMRLLDTDPAMGRVHRVLADVYFHKQDDLKAEQQLEHAIRIFKLHEMAAELEEAVLLICQHLNQQGDFQSAYRKLEHYHQYLIHELGQRGILL